MVKIAFLPAKKIRASTILEVVVSMVIIVFVIGIALMILSNVARLSLSGKKLQANILVQNELLISAANNSVTDTIYQIHELKIERDIKQNDLGSTLFTVNVKATDPNKVILAEARQVVIHESN